MKVAVAGAAGRMGREVCRTIALEEGLDLVCAFDPAAAGTPLQSLAPDLESPLVITGDRRDLLGAGTEAVVDFTVAAAAVENIPFALENGIHVVAGTTGFSSEDLEAWRGLCGKSGANCLIAPNFAIGAILLMRFASIAARYMPACEIIELHHPYKLDAPSGTARLTAGKVAAVLADAGTAPAGDAAPQAASRGLVVEGIPVHSVRLPGLVAHQEVIFGGQGQTLSIRHDSIDRTSFMPGVVFALRRITEYPGLTVGLENWMEE
jgi:4-hydroxy-tetrahydrodipicolinate reductase